MGSIRSHVRITLTAFITKIELRLSSQTLTYLKKPTHISRAFSPILTSERHLNRNFPHKGNMVIRNAKQGQEATCVLEIRLVKYTIMAKEENTSKETWTTWEELLLACAVKRHGLKNWDSVAMEIQTRSSLPHLLTTPQNCKQKYQDLKRRFTTSTHDANEETETDDKVDSIPWLDELRKLRVAELRQEVHRSDVSILTLQLKVKRLKEERERSLKESENDDEKPDLEKDSKDERSVGDKKDGDGEPEKSSPERVAGKLVSGEESDRENQSVNESNSTGTKRGNRESGVEDAGREPEPVQTGSEEPEPILSDSKPVGEDSYNESSDSIAKDLTVEVKKAEDSSELRDSVGESKRGEERRKENSDVQSSASLTRKTRRREVVSGGNSGEELGAEAASRGIKRISVKSQPLVEFLEMIRSHKHGSSFERRLQSQETDQYRNVVRQHMDLETMQKRLEDGSYSSCTSKFYRDLLLLLNNAIIFFPKTSVESVAGHELRNLVSNEMEKEARRSDPSPEPNPSQPPPPPPPPQPKPDPERSDSLLAKHKSSAPIIVCRKRSSISAKASSTKKGEQRSDEKKPVIDVKPPVKSSPNLVEEQSLMKMNTKDRTVTGARSLRRNSKTLTNSTTPNKNQSTSPGSDKVDTPKAEKKKTDTSTLAKKRSAADFLKRIKQNSPLEKLRSSVNDSKNSRGGGGGGGGGSDSVREQKRKRSEKRDGRKDRVLRQSGGGKHAKDESSPSKRGVGRPPKKAADAVLAKRGRESGGGEVVGVASKRPRKRSRR